MGKLMEKNQQLYELQIDQMNKPDELLRDYPLKTLKD